MTRNRSGSIFNCLPSTFRILLFLFLLLLPSSSLHLCDLLQPSSAYERVDSAVTPAHSSHEHVLSRIAPSSSDPHFSSLPTIKSIKVPSGTVKCSCQTVPDDEFSDGPSDDGKSIEIEIHKPEDGDDLDGSASEAVKVKKKPIRNSFTLEGDDENEEESASSEDRLFSTEEPPSFLSFLSNLYKNDMLNKHKWGQEGETKESEAHPGGSGSYKAFRSSELHGNPDPVAAGDESSSVLRESHQDQINKYHKEEEEQKENAPFFTWDFVYGHNKPTPTPTNPVKKREFMYLGSILDSFKGPRRKRRRRSLIGPRSNREPVVFVYPVGYHPATKDAEAKDTGTEAVANDTVSEHGIQMRSDPEVVPIPMDKTMLAQKMHESMERAWGDYGSNGLHNPQRTYVPPPPPLPESASTPMSSESISESISLIQAKQAEQNFVPPPPHPMDQALPYHQQISPYHVQTNQYYRPPRPFLFIDRIFNPFQPMGSEWDKHVSVYSQGPPLPPEPGMFSRFLANYIDFEVNNHETADIMRRVVFALFVGFLIVGWISLGVMLGVIPLKKWLAFNSVVGKKSDEKGKEFVTREANLSDLTDKILLALDADWLKRLEDRVMGSGEVAEKFGGGGPANGRKIPIQVFCCILPDEQVNGMVECQVSKSNHGGGGGGGGGGKKGGGKKSAFKCISDLIYNFQFGPKEDTASGEPDNAVNFKGKANTEFSVVNETVVTT